MAGRARQRVRPAAGPTGDREPVQPKKVGDLFNGVRPLRDRRHAPGVAVPNSWPVNRDDIGTAMSGGNVDNLGVQTAN